MSREAIMQDFESHAGNGLYADNQRCLPLDPKCNVLWIMANSG